MLSSTCPQREAPGREREPWAVACCSLSWRMSPPPHLQVNSWDAVEIRILLVISLMRAIFYLFIRKEWPPSFQSVSVNVCICITLLTKVKEDHLIVFIANHQR